jgi:hypothetical protein
VDRPSRVQQLSSALDILISIAYLGALAGLVYMAVRDRPDTQAGIARWVLGRPQTSPRSLEDRIMPQVQREISWMEHGIGLDVAGDG